MKRASLAGALLFLLVASRLCFWSEPYGVSVDESTYLSMAEVLHSGGTLYKDVVDRKPPGLIWLYQGIGEIFGTWNIQAVHLVFLGLVLALCLLLGSIVRELSAKKFAPVLAVFFFAIFSSCYPREVLSANAELPMTFCLGFSILSFIRGTRERNNFWIFLSVFLAGASTLFKQYGALVFLPIYLGWMVYEWRTRGFWKKHLFALVGSVLALALVYGSVMFYFYSENALNEFLNYFILDGFKYVAASRSIQNHSTSAALALGGAVASWPVLWWGTAMLFRKPLSWDSMILALGALGAAATVFLSGRYYTHYFIPLIWFLSGLAAIGLADFWFVRKKAILVFSLLPFIFYGVFNFDRERFVPSWSFTKDKQARLAEASEFIKAHTQPSDRIVVWGMASQIYVMSERGSGTRFVFADFVSGRQPGYKSKESVPTPHAMEEFLTDLDKNHPAMIVDTSTANLNDYEWFPITRFPEIDAYVRKNYESNTSAGGLQIWTRKVSSPKFQRE